MKRFFIFICLLTVIAPQAKAHLQSPFSEYLKTADDLYLVQVTSVNGDKATFSVTDVLRGKPEHGLVLSVYPSGQSYVVNSEWILASCRPEKNTVGWALKGDCGWIPGPVIRINGEAFVPCRTYPNSGIVLDTASDGTKGLTLDHIKQLRKDALPKN